jgi:hypothetical protein
LTKQRGFLNVLDGWYYLLPLSRVHFFKAGAKVSVCHRARFDREWGAEAHFNSEDEIKLELDYPKGFCLFCRKYREREVA